MNNKLNDYQIIQDYINKCDYTYKVEDIIEYYKDYWLNGYYVSFTMKDCIKNLEVNIKRLLKLEEEVNG